MDDKLDALEFTQMEANFWRMKYLKAQEEKAQEELKKVAEEESKKAVEAECAALREDRDWMFKRMTEYMRRECHDLTMQLLPIEIFEERLKVQLAERDAIRARGEK